MQLQNTMKKRGSLASWRIMTTMQQQPSPQTSTETVIVDTISNNDATNTTATELQPPPQQPMNEDSSHNSFTHLLFPERHSSTSLSALQSCDGSMTSVVAPQQNANASDRHNNYDDSSKQQQQPLGTSSHSDLALSLLPLYRNQNMTPSSPPSDCTTQLLALTDIHYNQEQRIRNNNPAPTNKVWQLLLGASGIYAAYLYYGVVQEDLFRYRSKSGTGFSFVWALQVLESAVTITIGYFGRKLCGGRNNLPLVPFFKSGASQLAAKALMSLSLAAGLSFPVVVLAKAAKIVPVMIGQLLMGGSSYTMRDYTFAFLIVAGTSLLSTGNTSEDISGSDTDTFTGLVLITFSLTADGFTGGLQKKLKRVTASMAPTTYDFLYYSHIAQFCVAIVICCVTGEVHTAPTYVTNNPTIWWWIGASCICSAIGQCFIFYVISCFDPVVCTTITTTRKMLTVVFSICFKGHHLNVWGCFGLGLAVTALLLEVEGKYAKYRVRQHGTVEVKQISTVSSTALNVLGNNGTRSSSPTVIATVSSSSCPSIPVNGSYSS
jgi:solute carrier family 35 (UDP-galactose transporter), member B1